MFDSPFSGLLTQNLRKGTVTRVTGGDDWAHPAAGATGHRNRRSHCEFSRFRRKPPPMYGYEAAPHATPQLFSAHRPTKKFFPATPVSIQLRRSVTSSRGVSPNLTNVKSTCGGAV